MRSLTHHLEGGRGPRREMASIILAIITTTSPRTIQITRETVTFRAGGVEIGGYGGLTFEGDRTDGEGAVGAVVADSTFTSGGLTGG